MVAIRLQDIRKSYGPVEVIKGVSFEAEQGEFVVFVGPSGCGKSTILRMIAGLEKPDSGEIYFGDDRYTDVPPGKREIGMVFQSYALYPHMSVADNMTVSLRLAGVPKTDRRKRAVEVARMLKLDELLDRKPAELSGGQRQRVAIGRAIVRDPKAFLFDEPLSNLDAALRVETRLEISRLHQQINTTMIYVTHDQTEAMTMADRIVLLDAGQVVQQGTPLELYRNPANLFVATFLGSPKMNVLDVAAVSRDGTTAQLTMAGASHVSVTLPSPETADPKSIGVRPEDTRIVPEGEGVLSGTIISAEHLGSEVLVHTETAAGQIIAKMPPDFSAHAGDTVWVGFNVARAHLFDADGLTINNHARQ
ncbi:ABC transporter ATP-binding protein [Sinisalibacter aestuarii]|uniref:ABC transporter ATP-binding protein n=1 Tax=Sinisalibacter aestuarii TaxID=2949426 RepID=A0ABQ5LRN8_9RHOB|nr:ABC transporter ATP-binding protein [Sinisalibacter aestuarii]GKY87403.1 ABC transporter ATP-binding protein [Sinisalibacter aestuarii]